MLQSSPEGLQNLNDHSLASGRFGSSINNNESLPHTDLSQQDHSNPTTNLVFQSHQDEEKFYMANFMNDIGLEQISEEIEPTPRSKKPIK